ncbi:Peroxisome biogenesis protein 1 isoform J [Glycine soja]|uniref:Peroxisomal ATPase PEX1 n=2 Tax=Glycine soja TaxID=3848 RepID=A0A445K089_GLYSO|nr:Peroxisome biogenesis protein 1 isoform B [Glycine soja]RZC04158.1 Peroxisome biogenesis protein 1 isoform J [Glycine soja]
MELEVQVVGGIDSCFVSLPLSLIQTLQSTRSSPIPQILALELRSPTHPPHTWFVAWSGATSSSSSAIEVSPQFAECVSLPNHATVQVRAAPNVPHASLVTIEPHTEDDWEILELNADQAEAQILSQVRIVHEGMRFPLWLHGHTVITFQVASVFPKNVVVQLMPGTEVAVAPKRRKKSSDSAGDSHLDSSNKEHTAKMLLRLQDPDGLCSTSTHVKGVELHVGLTSVAFVHPETAKKYSFNMLQLVSIVPRVTKENVNISRSNIMKAKSGPATNEVENGYTDKTEYRQTIVQLLISESVAEGHVMVAKSLRLYLRASLHSWVYLKACDIILEKSIPSTSLFPCQFKLLKQENAVEKDGLEVFHGHKNHIDENLHAKPTSGVFVDTIDWSIQNEVAAALSDESSYKAEEEATNQSQNQRGLQSLVRLWYIMQLKAITSISGMEVSSLIIGNKTLLHFEVSCYKLRNNGKVQLAYNSSENSGKAAEMLFLLTFGEEYLHHGKLNAYEVALGGRLNNINIGDLKLFERMKLCDPVSIHSIEERASEDHISSNVSSLGWMEKAADDVINRMLILLCSASGLWFGSHNLPLPGHVLIYGPSGSGKTILARTVAKSLENREDILAHIIFVSCSKLALEKVPVIRQELANHVTEALNHAPSVVIFDDLDSIISTPDSEGSQLLMSVAGLTDFLIDIMDEYREKRQKSCGFGPIAFIASIQSLEKIPQSLSSSGRFDFHIKLPAPAASERRAMLKHEIQRRQLQCDDDILLDVAVKCDGYDGYDLEILVDRTVHAAVCRFLPSNAAIYEHESPALLREDFSQAMLDFLPVAMRDITKSASDDGRSGWDDVGGLVDIRNAIKEMIELPSKFPKTFAQAPLRLRSNVLLYGPPGCGKTHIVGAAAAASSLRFISVKGPELLNKYIGASEQAVRDIFSKAAAAAPCLLFFDEFDSIAPKRGHDNTGVTDRVVNQFLTELDGVEILTGVFVFAATSRPDLLDAALLRPGRLDRLLFCDFPSLHERLEILAVLSRKLPMANDVDLDTIANMTEGFSGADLQALLSDAQLAAVHDVLDSVDASRPEKTPVITDALLKFTASKARPSVSEEEKRRLYNIYHQFLDSKRSVAAQVFSLSLPSFLSPNHRVSVESLC